MIDYVDANAGRQLSLAMLSKAAGMSPFHFHRLFQAATGTSAAKRIRLLRLKRASMRLAFQPSRSITDIAFEAGFENAESLSRAFRRAFGQSPREFRRAPQWRAWRNVYRFQQAKEYTPLEVTIVDFPETPVAALEHRGPAYLEYETARKFIAWRIANGLSPERHRTFGVHYCDPTTTPPHEYRMDLCVSVDRPVEPNPQGIVNKVIPAGRCAVARYVGPRENIPAARYLHEVWLPSSGAQLRSDPMFFHYVNVGPNVQEHEMITDVYLPIR